MGIVICGYIMAVCYTIGIHVSVEVRSVKYLLEAFVSQVRSNSVLVMI